MASVRDTKPPLLLAGATADGTIFLWDARTGRQLAEMQDDEYFITMLQFSPDNQLLASTSSGEHVVIWDLTTFTPKFVLD
jgi:WD40 repeat protein